MGRSGVPTLKEFTEREAALFADLARRVELRVETVPDTCVYSISGTLPVGQAASMPSTLIALATDFLTGFLDKLAAGDPEAALVFTASLTERVFKDRFRQPQFEPPSLSQIFASAHAFDLAMREEIDRCFADNEPQRAATHLACARLWTRFSETVASAFSPLCEEYWRVRYEQAEEASTLKSASAAGMAHEIRTPLNVILGYADLMAERLEELNEPAGPRFADPIRRAGQRLLATIGAMLELSRIEAGAYELKPAALKLAPIVERQVSDLRVLARNKRLQLLCVVEEPDAAVRFDEDCLAGALINLLQNAIKFTEEGTVSVRLFRDASGGLALEVRDTGIGMEASYMPRLFQPFSREMSDPSKPDGTGLGLALVKRYLELNGARIEVQSQKKVGSVFKISFAGLECATVD